MQTIKNIAFHAKSKKISTLLITAQVIFVMYMLFKAFFSPALCLNINSNLNSDYIAVSSKIPSGAYEITVDYNSFIDDTKNVFNHACEINLLSESELFGNPIILDDAHSSVTGRMWVPFGISVEDLNLQVIRNGMGEVQIDNIVLRETIIYRHVRLIGFILLFGIIDFFVYLFSCKNEFWQKKRKTILLLSIITFMSSLLAFVDFFSEGHDLYFHLVRIVSAGEELSNGQFPVRMMTEMLNGYGYPNSLYYCDLFLYIPALLYKCMVPLHICYHIYLLIINMVTVWISYYAFKKITGDNTCGILGAALYTLSVYRLVCIYVRAAVGEYTAMAFLPLVLLGMCLIYNTEKVTYKEWLILAVGMSGIILCHIISTFIVVLFLILVCIICIRKTLAPNKLFAFAKASLTSFFLCAWFLVPFIDSSLSNETAVMQRDYVLQDCNTYLFQLFNIFPSADGLSHITYKLNSITSISIGLPLTVGIVCIVYYLYTSKKGSKKNVVLTFSLSLVALFLTSNLFPWYLVQQYFGKLGELIRKIQFPWRFMSVATVLLVSALVICFKELRNSNKNTYLIFQKYVIISIVLSIGFFNYNFSISTSNRELYDLYNRSFSTISNGEYLLEGTDYESLKSALPYSSGGDTIIESYKKQNGSAVIHCSNISESTSEIELPILAYDNYCAVDTSTKKQFRISTGDNNRILITLPPNYSGEIAVRFVSPWYWRVAECISMLSVIVIVSFSIIRKIKSRKENNEKNSKSYCI